MSAFRSRLRTRARVWVSSHDFPGRRALLVEHHRLPFARLKGLADLLVPPSGENALARVEVIPGAVVEVNLRSAAQRAIAYGLSDESELAILQVILRPGDVVLDVGANIGLYTVVAARAVGPLGRVYAFEPNPETARQLKRNIRLNELENVEVHVAAVADREGVLTLRSPDVDEPGLATVMGEGQELARVRALALDDFVEARSIQRIALLKIDAEGAEPLVLEGARTALERGSVERVLVEVLDGTTAAQKRLTENGFALSVVLPPDRLPLLLRACGPNERFTYANILGTGPHTRGPTDRH